MTVKMSLTAALKQGWGRMVQMLFRPFVEPGKWFVVGFAAWLAGLTRGCAGYGGASISEGDEQGHEEVVLSPFEVWEQFMAYEWAWRILAVALVLGVLFLWVSSRAKFVFLDNVVHDRSEIAEPWRRYREAGNSLFVFRIVAVLLTSVAAVLGPTLLGALLAFGGLYAFFFLDAYVVPLMHRYDLGAMDAWQRFAELARQRWGWFLLSGPFVAVLVLLVGFAIVIAGILTFCLGVLVLMIPYIGTVVALPLLVLYRAATVEFLAQADPELLRKAGSE